MPSPLDWDAWRQQARASTEGMNKMPGVFSDFAGLAQKTPEQVQQTFFPGMKPSDAHNTLSSDPLVQAYLKEHPELIAAYQENPAKLQHLAVWLQQNQAQAAPQVNTKIGNPLFDGGVGGK